MSFLLNEKYIFYKKKYKKYKKLNNQDKYKEYKEYANIYKERLIKSINNSNNKLISEKLDNTNVIYKKNLNKLENNNNKTTEKLDKTNLLYIKNEKIYNNDYKTLFLNRRDGLGSRLINILVGIHYCNILKLNHKIIWANKYNCNCNFKDLFKYTNHINMGKIDLDNFLKNNKVILMNNIPKIKKFFFSNNKNNKNILPFFNKIGETNIKNKFLSSIFRKLGLSNEVKNILKSFKEKLDNIVGVHVRRGDLMKHRKIGQRKRMIPNLKYFKYLDKHNIKKIFLCSDSQFVFDDFKKKYKIIKFENKVLNRDTKIGMQYSLVDIILLSRCKYIIGGESGFSQIASIVGNKKLIKLK